MTTHFMINLGPLKSCKAEKVPKCYVCLSLGEKLCVHMEAMTFRKYCAKIGSHFLQKITRATFFDDTGQLQLSRRTLSSKEIN